MTYQLQKSKMFHLPGGSLYTKVSNAWSLRGIVSSSLFNSDGSCNINTLTVYTKVSDFYEWIGDIIESTR